MAARGGEFNLASCAGRISVEVRLRDTFVSFVIQNELQISRYEAVVDLDQILSRGYCDLRRTNPIRCEAEVDGFSYRLELDLLGGD